MRIVIHIIFLPGWLFILSTEANPQNCTNDIDHLTSGMWRWATIKRTAVFYVGLPYPVGCLASRSNFALCFLVAAQSKGYLICFIELCDYGTWSLKSVSLSLASVCVFVLGCRLSATVHLGTLHPVLLCEANRLLVRLMSPSWDAWLHPSYYAIVRRLAPRSYASVLCVGQPKRKMQRK